MKVSIWAREIDHGKSRVQEHIDGHGWVTWHSKKDFSDVTIHANVEEIPQLEEMIYDLTRLRDALINRRANRISAGSVDGLDDESSEEQGTRVWPGGYLDRLSQKPTDL